MQIEFSAMVLLSLPLLHISAGCISVPVNISLRWVSVQSGYAKALKAKERLLAIIKERVESSLLVLRCCVCEEDERARRG